MMMTVNLIAPQGWGDMSQHQLSDMLKVMVYVNAITTGRESKRYEESMVSLLCLLRWNNIRIVSPHGDGWILQRGNDTPFFASAERLAAASSMVGWVAEAPTSPVRIDKIGDAQAASPDLDDGTSFDTWLTCETLWQQYQATQDQKLLRLMCDKLYHTKDIVAEQWQLLGVWYWWAGVKSLCNALYPNFFKAALTENAESASDSETLRRNIDSQIRALTKGDITKEDVVLSMPCHRALTELDALAREYDELNRKYPNK